MTIGSAAGASSQAAMPTRTTVVRSAHVARNILVISCNLPAKLYRSAFSSRATRQVVLSSLEGFQPRLSVRHNHARWKSDADLAIVANSPWMEWEHCIAIYIRRNCLFRRRLGFYQLVAIVEDCTDDFVDQIVRQVLVRDRKVVDPNRVIIVGARTIGAAWNQGRRDFRHFVPDHGTLLGRRLYEI